MLNIWIKNSLIFSFLITVLSSHAETDQTVDFGIHYVGHFSKGSMLGWEEKEFDGETVYGLVFDKDINKTVLKASSQASASGLFHTKRIDLAKTPWLQWSWKTNQHYQNPFEDKKQGDDFVARLYLIIDGGIFFWNTKALNYVWSSELEIGHSWPNPYVSNNLMHSVETGKQHLNQWQFYSRNIRDDLKRLLGKDVQFIDAVAVMTDSDDTQQHAISYYGDIFFSNAEIDQTSITSIKH